jgi:hypothetical protein
MALPQLTAVSGRRVITNLIAGRGAAMSGDFSSFGNPSSDPQGAAPRGLIPAGGPSSLGSLTQSARLKQLNTARWILLAIGVLSVVVNVAVFFTIESEVDTIIQRDLNALRMRGMAADPAEVARFRESTVRVAKLLQAGFIFVSGLFIVFGLTVKKYPVPITVTALVLYLGVNAITGVLDPSSVPRGIIVKIIIIVALVASVQSALAYQREKARPARQAGLPAD